VVPVVRRTDGGRPNADLPRSDEDERALIATLWLARTPQEAIDTLYAALSEGLDAADFWGGRNRRTFEATARLVERQVPPSPVTVRSELEQLGTLDHVGAEYLSGLTSGVARGPVETVRYLARRLKTLSRQRTTHYAVQRLAEASAHERDEAKAQLQQALDAERQPDAAADLLLDDAALMCEPELDYLCEGRILAGSFVGLIGEPDVGKSLMGIDLGVCVPAGQSWLGAPVRPGPVIYVAGEGAAGLKARIRACKVERNIPLDRAVGLITYRAGAVNLMDAVAVRRFIALIRPHQPVLVVFDTLARCMVGGDENATKDMGLVISSVDLIRTQLGATVLVLHHPLKSNSNVERGSSALAGALDTKMLLKSHDDVVRLTCEKQKDAEPFGDLDVRLMSAHGSKVVKIASAIHPRLPEISEHEMTISRQRSLDALREQFAKVGAITATAWQRAANEAGIHKRTFYRALRALVEAGLVKEEANRYQPT
jgi:hypothetical protein